MRRMRLGMWMGAVGITVCRPGRRQSVLGGAGVLCAVLMVAGCQSQQVAQTPTVQATQTGEPEQLSNTDPCAMQLHDLCGSLLLYYLDHGQLPGRLEDIQPTSDVNPVVTLTCPVSGKRYVYDAKGLVPPDGQGRIIVWDATPAHLGMRWAIKIGDLRGGRPLVARVVALPESYFRGQGVGVK